MQKWETQFNSIFLSISPIGRLLSSMGSVSRTLCPHDDDKDGNKGGDDNDGDEDGDASVS